MVYQEKVTYLPGILDFKIYYIIIAQFASNYTATATTEPFACLWLTILLEVDGMS